MSSLNSSIIFKTFSENGEIMTTITKCIKNGMVLDSSYIEEQMIQMKRTRISPFVDKVLNAYENGHISLIYSKNTRVPQAVPFIVLKQGTHMRAFVFVNNYGTVNAEHQAGKNAYLTMPMKDLYVLMEGAYTALTYFQFPAQVTKSLGLMKLCNTIYTEMFLRILNKIYALSLQQDLYNQVSFCISKYFLENVWEQKNKQIATSYANSNLVSANKADMMITAELYDQSNITDIDQLIKYIQTLSPRMSNLNFRYFAEYWINMYKPGAVFAMETLPYFIYVIEASMIGSFLVNQPAISQITKTVKGMNSFYQELSKVLL